MHNLVLKSDSPTTRGLELYLDGMKLEGLVSYELQADGTSPHVLRLEMYVNSVNRDDEVLKTLVLSGAITK